MNPGKIFVDGIESLIRSPSQLNFSFDALLESKARVSLGKDSNSLKIEMNYDNNKNNKSDTTPRSKL